MTGQLASGARNLLSGPAVLPERSSVFVVGHLRSVFTWHGGDGTDASCASCS